MVLFFTGRIENFATFGLLTTEPSQKEVFGIFCRERKAPDDFK